MKPNSLLLEHFDIQEFAEKSDAEIFAMQSAQRYKTIRNNFYFVMILNVVCLFGNTFSISFYQWYAIQQFYEDKQEGIWLNMLYLYNSLNDKYMSFSEYKSYEYNICNLKSVQNTQKCLDQLTVLQWIGGFCFLFILISQSFLIYDIVRLRTLLNASPDQEPPKGILKGSMVYALIIGMQSFALILYLLAILCLDGLNLRFTHFGASYWVCWFCCLSMIIFAIYYRWSKARYSRFLIMEKLVTQELSRESLEISLVRRKYESEII